MSNKTINKTCEEFGLQIIKFNLTLLNQFDKEADVQEALDNLSIELEGLDTEERQATIIWYVEATNEQLNEYTEQMTAETNTYMNYYRTYLSLVSVDVSIIEAMKDLLSVITKTIIQ